MRPPLQLLAIACVCAVAHCHGQGTLIAGHFGDADPTTEGFTLADWGNPSLAPVMNDQGLKAWSIGVGPDDGVSYYRALTAQQTAALASGWALSLTLRVVAPFSQPTGAIYAKLQTGTENFPNLEFGAGSGGDPIVRVGSIDYVLEGAGSGYHSYQLKYDGDAGLASLWVDEVLLATDIAEVPSRIGQFSWGGGQRPSGSGYANWNEVSLTAMAVPEPGTSTLLTIGGALLLVGTRGQLKA